MSTARAQDTLPSARTENQNLFCTPHAGTDQGFSWAMSASILPCQAIPWCWSAEQQPGLGGVWTGAGAAQPQRAALEAGLGRTTQCTFQGFSLPFSLQPQPFESGLWSSTTQLPCCPRRRRARKQCVLTHCARHTLQGQARAPAAVPGATVPPGAEGQVAEGGPAAPCPAARPPRAGGARADGACQLAPLAATSGESPVHLGRAPRFTTELCGGLRAQRRCDAAAPCAAHMG